MARLIVVSGGHAANATGRDRLMAAMAVAAVDSSMQRRSSNPEIHPYQEAIGHGHHSQ